MPTRALPPTGNPARFARSGVIGPVIVEAQQVQEGGGDDRHHRKPGTPASTRPAAGRDGAQFRGLGAGATRFLPAARRRARRERSAVRGRAGQGPGRGHGRAQKEEEAAHRSLLRGVILASTAQTSAAVHCCLGSQPAC